MKKLYEGKTKDVFALDNGNVMVVRDGQILIEATIDMSGYESSSKIGFKFRETSRSLYVSDLLLAKGVK